MLFNSFLFVFVFLPAAVAGFFAASAVNAWLGRAWLGLVSIAFYTYWYPPFTVLLLISICFNYGSSSLALRLREGQFARPIVAFGVASNLLMLFYYKYAYAAAAGLHDIGLTQTVWMDQVLLPLGISFFTFTQIGFLLDSMKGAVRDRSFVNYVLFVTFFPHLIAGPILHHREIMPQFRDDATYRLDWDNLARGLSLFSIGLFKKVLIADNIAGFSSPGFADPQHLTFFAAWGSALCYSLQLYFDFSGYSDMAIGIAKMCNVQFPMNFNSPYKARNIVDYWQRWHMTLTRYLTLYLYDPLALRIVRRRAAKGLPISRRATATPSAFAGMVVLPMFYTMVLAGVWHGAGSQFLIFGLLHACYLTINHAWRVFGPKRIAARQARPAVFARIGFCGLTYIAVLVAQVFFRAESTPAAISILAGMVGLHGVGATLIVPYWLPERLGEAGLWLQSTGWILSAANFEEGGRAIREIGVICLLFPIVWLLPNSQQIVGIENAHSGSLTLPAADGVRPIRQVLGMNGYWGLVVGTVAVAAAMGIGAKSEFLYFQF